MWVARCSNRTNDASCHESHSYRGCLGESSASPPARPSALPLDDSFSALVAVLEGLSRNSNLIIYRSASPRGGARCGSSRGRCLRCLRRHPDQPWGFARDQSHRVVSPISHRASERGSVPFRAARMNVDRPLLGWSASLRRFHARFSRFLELGKRQPQADEPPELQAVARATPVAQRRSKPNRDFCSIQAKGRSMRFVNASIVRTTG